MFSDFKMFIYFFILWRPLEVDLEAGTACVQIFVPKVPDPIYRACTPFTCQDITPYIPNICPFKQGGAYDNNTFTYLVKGGGEIA